MSDLHLDGISRPDAVAAFLRFLEGPARDAERLFILGDLFEAWIGDDDDAEWLVPIKRALRALGEHRVGTAFMHGNRDFLVGTAFESDTGVRLLDEYERIELGDETVLLTHGDLLCTDDLRYLTLRDELHDSAWQSDFLGKPLDERRRIANELRELSQTEIASKPEDIMDVNAETVDQVMRRYGVSTLIHGHTHRPGIHRWTLDGAEAVRVVLGDWYQSSTWLVWDRDGPRTERL